MRVHFIGIGGIGLSAIAQIMNEKGNEVSGSDNAPTKLTQALKKQNIKIYEKHDEQNVDKNIELVVYSPAIPKNNVELKKAKRLKIKIIPYAQALGELSKNMYTIAIAGTHGKSTTTAMVALILKKAKFDPTVVIGTKMAELKNNNFKVGKSNYLVVEACEYKKNFLNLNPDILIITNIELDHIDYYKNIRNYIKAFKELVKKMPEDGTIIISNKDKNAKEAVKNAKCQIIKWGTKVNEKYRYENSALEYKESVTGENKRIKIDPNVPGEFNKHNAVFATMQGLVLQIEERTIEKAIKEFKGTWRRMEIRKTKFKKKIFIDDYAHHPTEIKETLKAMREKYKGKKMLVIYQPHQYSRTKHMLKKFGKSFKNANMVVIPNIYKVRDKLKDAKSVSTNDFVKEIIKNGKNAIDGKGIQQTAEYIKENKDKYDIIITMGAGDIEKIYDYL